MNERIKELADQAGFGSRRDGEIYTSRLEHLPITEDLAKFAELIVAECAAVAGKFVHDNKYKEGGISEFWLKDGIKEHFGVEE